MTDRIHPLSQTAIPFATCDLVCKRELDEFPALDHHPRPGNLIMFARSRLETQFENRLS